MFDAERSFFFHQSGRFCVISGYIALRFTPHILFLHKSSLIKINSSRLLSNDY